MAKVKDLKVREPSYWDKRMAKVHNSIFNGSDKTLKDLNKIFRGAYAEMNNRLQADYSKYGKIVESPVFTTAADGTQVVSGTSKKLALDAATMNVKLKNGTRLKMLQDDLSEILKGMSKEQQQYMIATLTNVADRAYYETMYELQAGLGVGKSFAVLSPSVVKEIINSPVNGSAFSDRIWDNTTTLAKQVNEMLKTGIVQGLSNGEMANRLSKRMDTGYSVAERLINTEVANTLNQASMRSYGESGVVKQYQFLATLDNRTSTVCQSLDNQVFDTDKAVVGINYPPMHPNCRSTTKAYFDTSADGLTRIARDLGGNSYLVPANLTYEEWKEKYT